MQTTPALATRFFLYLFQLLFPLLPPKKIASSSMSFIFSSDFYPRFGFSGSGETGISFLHFRAHITVNY
jgi:hypothetical protein